MADGLPLPLQIATKLGVHFSDSRQLYKDDMGIKKIFHLYFQNYQLSGMAISA